MSDMMMKCQFQTIALICIILEYKITPTLREIHGISKFFEKSCTVPQNCFVSLTIVDHFDPLSIQSYFIFYLFILHDFASDMMTFQSLCPFVHLSGANEFHKFLIFFISDLIIFFHILQQVDQKKMAMGRSNKYCYFFRKFFCLGR